MELKDVLNIIGMEGVKDLDSFKEKFQGKFITKEDAADDDEIKSKITGKVTGAMKTVFKRLYGLENAEINDKKWEDIAELGATKLKSQIKELEGKAGQSNDEALKEFQLKLEKANKTIEEYKDQTSTLQQGLESTEKSWSEKYTGLKKNNILEGAKSKLSTKLREMTDLERTGFDFAIKQNIQIEFDEKEEPVVKGPDGKRIPNPNKIGSFLSLDEALELEAVKGNVIKKNNAGGQTANPGMFQPSQPPAAPAGQQQTQGRQVHPNALKQIELLKARAAGNQ